VNQGSSKKRIAKGSDGCRGGLKDPDGSGRMPVFGKRNRHEANERPNRIGGFKSEMAASLSKLIQNIYFKLSPQCDDSYGRSGRCAPKCGFCNIQLGVVENEIWDA
jgi:hypothetical protein